MSESEQRTTTIVVPAARSQTVWWVIAVCLAVIATCLVMRADEKLMPSAHAQSVLSSGARGVFAFTGQIGKSSYGVFMVDVDTGTLWCYEFTGASQREMKLVAARSWRFDRYLEDFNIGDPSPDEVEKMVDQQRAMKLQAAGGPP